MFDLDTWGKVAICVGLILCGGLGAVAIAIEGRGTVREPFGLLAVIPFTPLIFWFLQRFGRVMPVPIYGDASISGPRKLFWRILPAAILFMLFLAGGIAAYIERSRPA